MDWYAETRSIKQLFRIELRRKKLRAIEGHCWRERTTLPWLDKERLNQRATKRPLCMFANAFSRFINYSLLARTLNSIVTKEG
jgi:hypothetical protein